MKLALYVWEYGADLGHISVFLPIALQLRQAGWEVQFAIPYCPTGRQAKGLLERHGFGYIENAGATVYAQKTPADSHAEMMATLNGFRSQADIDYFFGSWLELYDDLQPDVVIADFSLIGLLAARTRGIPTVALDHGYFVPALDHETPLPLFGEELARLGLNTSAAVEPDPRARERSQQSEQDVLQLVNHTLTAAGHAPLPDFRSIYAADKHLLLNYPELSPFAWGDTSVFRGAVMNLSGGIAAEWPQNSFTRPRIFAYMKMGTPEIGAVMEALRQATGCSVLVYIPHCPPAIIEKFSSPHLFISAETLDIRTVLRDANLVICHAGAGMIAQSLLHGIPLLMAPQHTEQQLNALRVCSLQAGALLPAGANAATVNALLETVLGRREYISNARSFGLRHRPADVGAIVEEITSLVPAGHVSRSKAAAIISSGHDSQLELDFGELDLFFLDDGSQPAQDNWQQIQRLAPHAQRIDAAEGEAKAVLAASRQARSERFFTLAGNTVLREDLLQIRVQVPRHLRKAVWQWPTVHATHGLIVPLGGVVSWTRDTVNTIAQRSAGEPSEQDLFGFFLQPTHYSFARPFSLTRPNGTPQHAFHAGYQASQQLAMTFQGDAQRLLKFANVPHTRKLFIAMSAGADAPNGHWSMLGARMAFLALFAPEHADWQAPPSDEPAVLWQLTLRWLGLEGQDLDSAASGQVLEQALAGLRAEVAAIAPRPAIVDMNGEQSAQFKQALTKKRNTSQAVFEAFNPNDSF